MRRSLFARIYLLDMLNAVAETERTTTAEALLGMLSLAPMSGYAMRQLMEWSTGNFWQESYGQIYPTLRKLREQGLVELETAGGGGRDGTAAGSEAPAASGSRRGRESKVYRLTEAGRTRLHAWLRSASRPQVPRNELLLKIFFSGLVPVAVVREQVRSFCDTQTGLLARYAVIEERVRREGATDKRLPLWLMTLRYGQAESRAMVLWAEEALRMCEAMEAGQAI